MPDIFTSTTPARFRQAINRFVPAFCLSFLSLSGSTLAAPWTVTATGTIQTGIDGLGIFGPAGSNLTGLFVTQSITLDPLLFHTQNNSDPNYVHSYGSLNGGTATVQVTVTRPVAGRPG